MNVYSNAVANPDGVEAIEKDNRQHKVRNGDVFFTGSSETPDEVGLSSVWLGNSTDTYLNSFCFGYRPSKQLDSLFLASSLRSPQMRSRMILLAQGISRFNISKTQVMQLLYFVKLICTVSSLFLDSFVVHSGRFGLSGFLLVLFGYFISEWVFL